MPNRRSPRKLEEKIARQYVYKHSVTVHRNNDPDEVTEKIYKGTSNDITEHVLTTIGEIEVKTNTKLIRGEIPDYPQALVYSDSRGEGFFDVHMS